MSNLLTELKAACHDRKEIPDGDKVLAGELIWLAGRPVATEAGYIGLSMGDGHTVIVSESAVRDVEKDDGMYFVRVPAGSPALVRSEVVTTLRGAPHDCGCSETSRGSVAKAAAGGSIPGTGSVIIRCPLVCRVDMDCSLVLTGTGRVVQVCVPILSCVRECPSLPA